MVVVWKSGEAEINLLLKWKLLSRALRDPGLRSSRVPAAVLGVLIDRLGPLGCFPSKRNIAGKCAASVSSIDRALIQLRKCSYIEWRNRFLGQELTSNEYGINFGLVMPNFTVAEPGLEECTETHALTAIADYTQLHYGNSLYDPSDVADEILAILRSEYPTSDSGRQLFKLLRDAERDDGACSELDGFIEMVLKKKSDTLEGEPY